MHSKIVILLTVVGFSTAVIDLVSPLERIATQILKTEQKQPNWTYVPQLIEQIQPLLPCLSQSGEKFFTIDSDQLTAEVKHQIENFNLEEVAQKILALDWFSTPKPSIRKADNCPFGSRHNEFFSSQQFRNFHDVIWKNDAFLLVVSFLQQAGFPNIYQTTKEFYKGINREDLIPTLPEGPPQYSTKVSANPPKHTRSKRSVMKNNIPIIRYDAVEKVKASCDPLSLLPDLLPLLNTLAVSNLDEVIKIFLYLIQEIQGSAGFHLISFVVLDPAIGDLVKTAYETEGWVETILPMIQITVLDCLPPLHQLNELLRQATGLDLHNFNLFKYTFNFIRWLLWNHPFPHEHM